MCLPTPVPLSEQRPCCTSSGGFGKVPVVVASHLVVDRLPSANQWNEILGHESEDTAVDLSGFSFRLSWRTPLEHRIPVTRQLSWQLFQLGALLQL